MPRTHDYSNPSWGHAISGWRTNDGGHYAPCCGWGNGISPGDYILLKNGNGTSRYEVVAIDYYRDPPDKWCADLKFAPRQEAPVSDKTGITKIEISTKSGVRVDLTLDEARELHRQLHEIFGVKQAPSIYPVYTTRPPYWDWRSNTASGVMLGENVTLTAS